MKELKCPKCGTSFAIDEADYASILTQVRNAEFEEALQIRIEETIAQHKAELVVVKVFFPFPITAFVTISL